MNPQQLQKMMKQAQKMQGDVEKVQEEINVKKFEGSTGGGAVEVCITGDKKIVSLNIKPEILEPEEKSVIEDMIISTINQTFEQIEKETEEKVGAFTKGLPF